MSATLPRYDEVGNDYDYANQHAYKPIEEGNAALSEKLSYYIYINNVYCLCRISYTLVH